MCTVKDLKSFLGDKGLNVGEARSLVFKLLDNLDTYQDSDKLIIPDRNNYKLKGITQIIKKRDNDENSSRYYK